MSPDRFDPPSQRRQVTVAAGGGFISALPAAVSFDSAFSFMLIRGGHLDMTVLGGLEVDANERLAN
jgi:acetate CoA/acetoacetate CoA-transferase beta subunit